MEGGEDENIGRQQFKAGHRGARERSGRVVQQYPCVHTQKKAFAFIVIIIKRSDPRQSCPQTEHSLPPSHQSTRKHLQLQDTTAAKTLNITPLHAPQDTLKPLTLRCSASKFHTYRRKNTLLNKPSKTTDKRKGGRELNAAKTPWTHNTSSIRGRRRAMTSQGEMFVFLLQRLARNKKHLVLLCQEWEQSISLVKWTDSSSQRACSDKLDYLFACVDNISPRLQRISIWSHPEILYWKGKHRYASCCISANKQTSQQLLNVFL